MEYEFSGLRMNKEELFMLLHGKGRRRKRTRKRKRSKPINAEQHT